MFAAQPQPVYTRSLPDGAMQLLKVARDRSGSPSSSQPNKKKKFSSVFVDTSPCLLAIFSARYAVGSGSASIRRTMLANSRLVMWLSANSSQ